MKKIYTLWVIFFVLSGTVQVACSNETLLDELDVLMETGTKADSDPAQSNNTGMYPFLGELAENLDLDITINSSQYSDGSTMEVLSRFSTWVGDQKKSLHFSGWLEYGSQEDTYSGLTRFWQDKGRERRILEISQAYGLFYLGEVELTMGKKVLSPDTNSIYPLSSFYHPLDLTVPVEPKTFGLWQISADYTIKDSSFIAYIFPVFQDHKIPGSQSRWLTYTDYNQYWFEDEFGALSYFDFIRSFVLYYFSDTMGEDEILKDLLDNENVVFENDLPEITPSEMGYGGKILTSFGGFDLFGSFFYGPNPYPVIRVEDRGTEMAVIKTNPSVRRLAAGGTTVWRNFEFHTEIMYSTAVSDTDDTYIAYTGGLTLTDEITSSLLHIDQMQWRIDYAGEKITTHQDHEGYYFSSESIRPFTNDILLQVLMQVNDDINITYFLDADLGNNAWYQRISSSYRLYRGVVAELFLEFFNGDEKSFIGMWKNNDRIGLKLTWTF